MKWMLASALALGLCAAEAPKVVYSKSFPGSALPYVAISVARDGHAVFNDSPKREDPIEFELEPEETEAIFSLAEKLDHFSRPLESGLKVARMGMKTFRYVQGGKQTEAKFNYTQDPDAQLLQDWFERITETVEHEINLTRAAKYDRLGVDGALLNLQISVERKRLAGGRILLPILDRIAKNGVYFNRARERAAAIADVIRAGKTKSE